MGNSSSKGGNAGWLEEGAPADAVAVWQKQFPFAPNDHGENAMYLAFCCRSVAKMDLFDESDPYLLVYQLDRDPKEPEIMKYFVGDMKQVQGSKIWTKIGETPYLTDDPNPIFVDIMSLDYKPDRVQKLRIEVYDYDVATAHDFIGASEVTISEILSSPNSSVTRAMESVLRTKTTGYLSIMVFDRNGQPFRPGALRE